MNKEEIEKEIEFNERKLEPLQRRSWKLYDQLHKVQAKDLLGSGILKTMPWRLRSYETKFYLQYGRDNSFSQLNPELKGDRWPAVLDEIIPYPHSHFELTQGVTLNQDDGDITLSFGTFYQLRKFAREQDLTIFEWDNLKTLLKKMRPYRSFLKELEARKANG